LSDPKLKRSAIRQRRHHAIQRLDGRDKDGSAFFKTQSSEHRLGVEHSITNRNVTR
jgi:hypothetical protein